MLRSSTRPLALVWLLTSLACDGGSNVPMPPRDEAPDIQSKPTTLSRIREDFDNFELVDRASGVIHDVNRGLVRLPTRQFPTLEAAPAMAYDAEQEVNGVIAGDEIVLDDTAVLRATDSVVLEARETLRITGELHVGPGGITLAAGRSIVIDGVVESEGPIQMFLGDAEGTVEILGRVAAISTPATDAAALPGVVISARGRVDVRGALLATAEGPVASGDVTIDAYGPILIAQTAIIAAPPSANQGRSGVVHLRSEHSVVLAPEAQLGNEPASMPGRAVGDIDVEAPTVMLGARARIVGSSSEQGRGASVQIAASGEVELGEEASISGGRGLQGGSISLHLAQLTLGERASILGGRGTESAGRVFVQAASMIDLEAGARLVGGDGACADGGDATLFVAGTLILGAGATIRGGDGGTGLPAEGCAPTPRRGGKVEVSTRAFAGDADGVSGGRGATAGDTRLTADPNVRVPLPELTASTQGVIESKPIDRGEEAVGQVPVLRQVQLLDHPAGTSIHVELAGAAEPFEENLTFVEGSTTSVDAFRALANARYFRYRVRLEGRAFDTPVIDFFEIDLVPAGPAPDR